MKNEVHYYRKTPVRGLARARRSHKHGALYRLMRMLKREAARGKE